jgi:phage protein D
MSVLTARRGNTVAIQVNGEPAPVFEDARIGFRFIDRIYKRDEAELQLADPDRKFRDRLLVVDDFYLISYGHLGNMSRPRGFKLKTWHTAMGTDMGAVSLKLAVTGRRPLSKAKKAQVPSEPHKTHIPRNWGRMQTSEIARRIAKRHQLKFRGDASDDVDRTDYVQGSNVSDYGYLRRLAENIDYEFFIETDTLYYRKKPYNEDPRLVFTYIPESDDSLLLKFQPDVKVTTVKTKPNSVDIEQGEVPWATIRKAAVEMAAGVFQAEQTDIEEAVDLLTDQVNTSWQTAESLREALLTDPNNKVLNSQFQQVTTTLTLLLQEQALQKRLARDNQKTVDKQTRTNRTKRFGDNDKGDTSCSKEQQMEGTTPTGNSRSSQDLLINTVSGETRVRASRSFLAERLGLSEANVRTADSTEKKRKKVACASHAKRKDKAVTARAEFWGDPKLRAKVTYGFRNVGRLFNGKWYAQEVTHDLPAAGAYLVTMSLKRGSLAGPNKKKNKSDKKAQTKKGEDARKSKLGHFINIVNGEESIQRVGATVPDK